MFNSHVKSVGEEEWESFVNFRGHAPSPSSHRLITPRRALPHLLLVLSIEVLAGEPLAFSLSRIPLIALATTTLRLPLEGRDNLMGRIGHKESNQMSIKPVLAFPGSARNKSYITFSWVCNLYLDAQSCKQTKVPGPKGIKMWLQITGYSPAKLVIPELRRHNLVLLYKKWNLWIFSSREFFTLLLLLLSWYSCWLTGHRQRYRNISQIYKVQVLVASTSTEQVLLADPPKSRIYYMHWHKHTFLWCGQSSSVTLIVLSRIDSAWQYCTISKC